MVRVLLFDADGVLFLHADRLFSDRIVEEYHADPKLLEHFFTTVFPDCILNKKDMRQELSRVMASWNWPGTVDELMEYWFAYERTVDQPLIDYIRRANERGVESYVATNNDHYRAQWLFNHLNLDQTVFQKLYAAGDLGIAKPDHGFFQTIIDDLPEVHKSEMLFWDDTERNVDAAREFGIAAELYTDFKHFKETMERYV